MFREAGSNPGLFAFREARVSTPETGQATSAWTAMRTPLNVTLLGLVVVVTVAGFLLIPDGRQLPVHWGLDGHVDATLPRNLALLQMPLATALVWLITWAINRWGNSGRSAGAAAGLRLILPGLTTLFLVIQLLIVLLGAGVALPFFAAY